MSVIPDPWLRLYQEPYMLEYVENVSPTCLSLLLTTDAPPPPGELLCHSEQVGVRTLQDRTRTAESHFPQDNARQQRKQRMAKE